MTKPLEPAADERLVVKASRENQTLFVFQDFVVDILGGFLPGLMLATGMILALLPPLYTLRFMTAPSRSASPTRRW
jgi:hypothetical protein